MKSGSVLKREGDGKEFEVQSAAHWSVIMSDDGEIDTVKWYGGDNYVSATKGHSYKLASR